jgi:exopolysaccharide production protein ExoQ
MPLLACGFALIIDPLLTFLAFGGVRPPDVMAPSPVPRIFWPAMALISILMAVQGRGRYSKYTFPANVVCLLAYLAFAGASVLWAFSPDRSFVRFLQQAMIIISIILPAVLAPQTADLLRGLFLCFTFASALNVFFVLGGSREMALYGAKLVAIGYPGYFLGKNYLGECATFTLLLAVHETLYRGWRRVLGIVVAGIAVSLVFLSDSKTALGLALICPLLAAVTLSIRKIKRISPAIILALVPLGYFVLSTVSNFNLDRLSYMVYGDSTLTGRTIIWDFTQNEIGQHPLLGWGYQSFWLVPGSPAFTEAPGWVKMMPNAHNGYYDTKLEMGYVGLLLLLIFIFATLHAVGRVADRDPPRAAGLLSLALFVISFNFLESIWMRGFEFLWVGFVIVAVEIGRYARPVPLRTLKYSSERFRNRGARVRYRRAGVSV